MTQRQEFVLRALEPGANISELCREFSISRKTGYKWIHRFKSRGLQGLEDLSRRPHSAPLRVPGEVVLLVIELRRQHPTWGPKKLRVLLARGGAVEPVDVPSVRTIARIIERAGLVRPRRRRRGIVPGAEEAPNAVADAPNDLWTVDFKGWWRTSDGRRAEPLTVRDQHSRYVLLAQLMTTTKAAAVREQFQTLFERYGMPKAIQSDNGSPFASTRARGRLTTLSAWWLSLGIDLVHGRPAHPQDNGAHERMHKDMRHEVEDLAADDLVGQQAALSRWREEFNHLRPHESLDMAVPGDIYRKSTRPCRGPRTPWYPDCHATRAVNKHGSIKLDGKAYYVSLALVGQQVGITVLSEERFRVKFFDMDLGELERK